MTLKYSFVFVLILLLIISCGLKQPEFIPETEIPTGSIYLNSKITGARIFVNSDSTGKVTPDTIKNIPVGSVIVQVFKDGYLIAPDSISVDVNSDSIVTAMFSLEFITNQGKLFFNSTPEGAEIFVNGSSAGKFTPDTIIVAAGMHQAGLYKNGFDSLDMGNIDVATNSLSLFNETLVVGKQVLIESFSNYGCLPCTTASANIEDFIDATQSSKFSLIEYFTDFPADGDPLYIHNIAGNGARFRTFYNLFFVPSMFIAGSMVDATNYNNIIDIFIGKLNNANQDVSISLSKQVFDSVKVNVEVNQFNTLPTGNWRLFIAVVEKEVNFNPAPGSNGLTKFLHVFRKFLSPNNGDIFPFTDNQFVKTYTGSISSDWNLSEIQIIGFIQNIDTKVVLKSSHL